MDFDAQGYVTAPVMALSVSPATLLPTVSPASLVPQPSSPGAAQDTQTLVDGRFLRQNVSELSGTLDTYKRSGNLWATSVSLKEFLHKAYIKVCKVHHDGFLRFMIELLDDVIYQKLSTCRSYGNTVYMMSCRIYIINSISWPECGWAA